MNTAFAYEIVVAFLDEKLNKTYELYGDVCIAVEKVATSHKDLWCSKTCGEAEGTVA